MIKLDQIRAEKLIQLARECFDPDLTEAELKVLRDSASPLFPRLARKDAPRPKIRSDFVRWLATDREAALNIDPRGLRIWGMTLPDKLDLAECRVFPALSLRRCTFEGEINLESAETRGIYVILSDLRRGIRGDGIVARSDFLLRRATCRGALGLAGARIGGNLDCSGTKFTAQGEAIWLDGAEIGGDIFFYKGFESSIEIRILGATIKGDLDCRGAKLRVANGDALSADGAEIGGDLILNEGFESSGTIRLLGARIKGDLDCSGAKLTAEEGIALYADGIDIGADVFLSEGFESTGEIRLLGAKIGGDLDCSGAKLKVTGGDALSADRTEIGGDVFLSEGFESGGTIRLLGTRTKGNLHCNGAKLHVREGDALFADGIDIGGDVVLNEGFESSGEVRVLGAQIKGNLDCSGAKLKVTDGDAFSADGIGIGGDVFLCEGFESSGEIRLLGAQIDGDLKFHSAKTTKVDCCNLRLNGDLFWMGILEPGRAYLDLTGAVVKNLRDDRESWPHPGNLILDGLAYEELTLHKWPSEVQVMSSSAGPELPLKVEERIEWLMLQPPDRRAEPQPWMQLSRHLEAKGERKDAKHVVYKLRCLQAGKFRFPFRQLKIAFVWLEESPLRIWRSIAFFLLLGWLVFGYAGARGAIAPTDVEAYKAFTVGSPMPAAYPTLNPFVYVLENSLPLVRLGQDDKWAPDRRCPSKSWIMNYWLLAWARWILILSGWFQAAVLGAALLGRFKE